MEYRYYTCCTAARRGKTGCKGRTIPMAELDALVVEHVETRLPAPGRLKSILGVLVVRRSERVQSLVQRAEVGADQIMVRGSALKLLQTLTAVSGGKPGQETARLGVRSFVPKWLPGPDSNQRPFD